MQKVQWKNAISKKTHTKKLQETYNKKAQLM